MEPHELAIAALSQVARNASHREQTEGGSDTPNEGCNATGNASAKCAKNDNSESQTESSQAGQESVHTHTQSTQGLPLSTINVTAPAAAPIKPPSSREMISCGDPLQLPRPTDIPTSLESFEEVATTTFTAGQKRTADGLVKSESASPVYPNIRQHSRNVSSVSNASTTSSTKIGELTSELRTRLSYAMIKVKKGWQSNTIDEVETLASQKGSPTSSVSTLQGPQKNLTSPRVAIAVEQGKIGKIRGGTADFDLYCRSEQPSKTYESFWRDHSVTDGSAQRPSTHNAIRSSPPSRVLAPPADIQSASFQRHSNSSTKYTRTPVRPSQSSNLPCSGTMPQTPRRVEHHEFSVMKPPPKTTVQEQDAIETLLFMSSPGNVGAPMGPTLPPPRSQISPQGSPLRTELYPQARGTLGRRLGTEILPGRSEKSGGEHRIHKRPKPVQQDDDKNASINRLLDEMGESTSDEEELVLKYSTPPPPPKMTVSRV